MLKLFTIVRSEKKTTTTTGTVGGATGGGAKKTVVVNETQVDLLLEMLKTADITTENEEELKTLNGLEGKDLLCHIQYM